MTNPTSIPGQAPAVYNSEAEIYWGGEGIEILRKSVVIDSSARDAGNAVTTTLRKGLLLAKKATDDGKLIPWEPTGLISDTNIYGVLDVEVNILEQISQVASDQFARLCVSAPVRAEALLIEGGALIGDAAEAAARTSLNLKNFRINDEY